MSCPELYHFPGLASTAAAWVFVGRSHWDEHFYLSISVFMRSIFCGGQWQTRDMIRPQLKRRQVSSV